ncbi:MAG: type II toxin-antitoxin system RelE/ParE family toxin [Pseudanabaena sp. M158S2SP1A06QC]|jgi:mRNA interferase RelE/StbE|uniref:type II toxin-antitoxin system RelE family toxin n=1 Tax=Pseudanabaena mucicola TaxID=71190 RepID=UPI00257894DB|nr:type II toxin-antitoxin system RelE/ParE family toxin [Pseudanabaena mucicola]MCA6502407.1 type II toxin-antitoxin system RelE/ParE family toxin [Pseudanabaena sp. M090S1SP2A07QC]MCA6522075.1 type II toxin-antitoxin system RelE/ParE family toxin [Pseudanabaena sp. M051S1SP2A07QC]MCA6575130.1 type II toxin-antitoxin system RelE/ParE family toxin [Pseudanabaena sp. M53BS1SP1A06MG]MCA6581930.1 type II toxin-antitoxin system RelE/ParE family toxin [Pseudanabaena sp. M34BS1SP1A06MG]MCA6593502.1 
MQVEFRKTFKQDLKNLKDSKVLKRIQKVVEEVELANGLSDIRNIKLLQGHEDFYRIRVGDYRIGLFVERETIAFVRVLHRKEVYRYFP